MRVRESERARVTQTKENDTLNRGEEDKLTQLYVKLIQVCECLTVCLFDCDCLSVSVYIVCAVFDVPADGGGDGGGRRPRRRRLSKSV